LRIYGEADSRKVEANLKQKFMYQRIENSEVRAHNNCPMETRDHFKNGVSPKNQRSRGNLNIIGG